MIENQGSKEKRAFHARWLACTLLAISGCCLTTNVSSGTTVGKLSTTSGSSTGEEASTVGGSATGRGTSSATGSSAGSTTGPLGSSTGLGVSSTGTSAGGSTTGALKPVSFQPAVPYPVGAGPYAIAVADYDSNHTLDLAVVNHDDGTVTLLSGNGDGTFEQEGEPVQIGGAAYWIAASDINGDGAPDLAIANSSRDSVQLLFNDAGGFDIPAEYPAGSGPNCVVAADFNGDGLIDLALSDYGGTTVSILWGAADGGFVPGQTLPGFDGAIFVAVLPSGSLAVADQHVDEVHVYDPKGEAGLEGPDVSSAGSWPTSLAVGDLNRDGIPDLAASDYNGGVAVMLGIADGGFQDPTIYGAGGNPNSVVMADFNQDGNLDLAVANSESFGPFTPGTVSILSGRGDGTFAPQVTFTVGIAPVDVAVGDFNRDGYPDLAVANSGDGTISILLGAH